MDLNHIERVFTKFNVVDRRLNLTFKGRKDGIFGEVLYKGAAVFIFTR